MIHSRSRRFAIAGCAMMLLVAGPATAADWPQWRGPARDGRIPTESLPDAWPESLSKAWSIEVGEGHSSPVVAKGRVYQHARRAESEVVVCFDAKSGREIWNRAYAAPYQVNPAARAHGPGPKSTPVVENGSLVTFGISGILACWNAETGEPKWRHDFADHFRTTAPEFGTAMSPIIVGGRVIAHVGGKGDGALAAFDLATGEEKWAWTGDGPGYASPMLLELAGRRQLVTQSQKAIVSLDPEDGTLLWKIPFETPYEQNSVTPVLCDGLLIVSGVQQPLIAYEFPTPTEPRKKWANDELPNYMSTPVVAAGRLFGLTHRNRGMLYCADPATGRMLWTSEGRTGDNALLAAGGDVVIAATTGGELLVLDARADSQQFVRRYRVAETPVWAYPAFAEKAIYIKDATRLTRWEVR